ncbi:gremlin-1-like [Amphibalanus amphitrite]|uniref:gremlin-1-like n=1 Tax=Amphibalanus amphitrite TaxID=1232801 RepID=UPI001C90EBF1|nr:gremlin-1-like [Amphibalanus amphitrite]
MQPRRFCWARCAAVTPGLLPLLPALLLALSAPRCGADPAGGHTIMEHVDMPAMTRVLEARAAAAAEDDSDSAAPPAEMDPAFGPVPAPSPSQRAAMASLPPTLLQSSRRARLVTKKKYLKKDWCKTEPLIRRLREPGCRSRRVIDRFCYGQCNSFYIPRESRRRRAFKSCPSCLPRRWERVSVLFHCPGQVPARRRRTVKLVKQCRCMPRRRR